jgi:hypothetical protein
MYTVLFLHVSLQGLIDMNGGGVVNEAFANEQKADEPRPRRSASPCDDMESSLSAQLQSILRSVRLMTLHLQQRKDKDRRTCQWMLVAQILDRVFLVAFLILIAIVHIAIFVACGMQG